MTHHRPTTLGMLVTIFIHATCLLFRHPATYLWESDTYRCACGAREYTAADLASS